jgi:ankyrin repeat protein
VWVQLGLAPLHNAVTESQLDVVNCLMELGASPFTTTKTGAPQNAMGWWAEGGRTTCVAVLLRSTACVIKTPIWFGRKRRSLPLGLVRSSLSHSYLVVVPPPRSLTAHSPRAGDTAVHLAAVKSSRAVMEALLHAGAPVRLMRSFKGRSE